MIYELGKQLNMRLECYEIKEKEGLPLYLSLRDLYHVHRNGVDFLLIELPSETDFKVSKLEKQLGLYQTHFKMICTLFTGHPVRRVFLCVTVMSIS